MKKLLFLYTEVLGYTESVLKQLIENFDSELLVIENDSKKLTPYQFSLESTKCQYYKKSAIKNLMQTCIEFNPNLVYISGWNDIDYLQIAKHFKSKNIPVVSGIDNHWKGTLRQRMASLFSSMLVKPYISYMWVAGYPQYEFARRLGFTPNRIIYNLYTADTNKFTGNENFNVKKTKNILFVGRFEIYKGYNLLVDTFLKLEESCQDWTLTLVGNTKENNELLKNEKIKIYSFLSSEELNKLARESMIFCLPSYHEPWGLVIHEFASSGLALLAADNCGAATTFLINGYNGFIFENRNAQSLEEKLKKIMKMSESELTLMGERSRQLSKRIQPEISAASILSILS